MTKLDLNSDFEVTWITNANACNVWCLNDQSSPNRESFYV